ncbi:DELLA protein DWARF8-like [Panicum miliaceum]|uniref:DELLA protein DWARF8-like n=1 Tax=Panicum miliaceum TaxID=4540 RepID=A0A3L6RN43_PANMI|nr:DELLA protein DWARF8-like [Panicum miliaceum]
MDFEYKYKSRRRPDPENDIILAGAAASALGIDEEKRTGERISTASLQRLGANFFSPRRDSRLCLCVACVVTCAARARALRGLARCKRKARRDGESRANRSVVVRHPVGEMTQLPLVRLARPVTPRTRTLRSLQKHHQGAKRGRSQWPALIHALSQRHGRPPYLRITGIGGAGDELGEVGARLEQFARSLDVPFTFREVRVDQLNGLRNWMPGVVPGEALAFNSVLQLHRLLVDPDADPAVPAPIDTLLHLVTSLQPRVFTVVEQEADHNRPALVERLTNALFHYGAMFDSMEAASHRAGGGSTTSALAEASLRAEILDVVCGEGSARAERHEPVGRWRERLARAGLTQLPFGADEVRRATAQLIRATLFSATGYGVRECAGSLALAWHDRPLYAATAWRATTAGDAAAAGAAAVATGERDKGRRRDSRNGSGESNGRGNRATA